MSGLSLEITKADLEALARRGATTWFIFKPFLKAAMWIRRLRYRLLFCLLSSPWGIRLTLFIANRLRWIHPIPKGLGIALPLSAPALRNALSRPEDFNGAEAMTLRLPAGEVVLGIDWQRRHAEERARIEQALDRSQEVDDARIRQIVRRRCRQVIPKTQTDLSTVNFARLFEDIALDVSEGYLGVGTFDDTAREHLRPIIRSLASRVFQGPIEHSIEDLIANIAADRMRSLVEHCKTRAQEDLAANPGKHWNELTVLQRLLGMVDACSSPAWLTQDWVVRNMITLSVFGSVTSARAMTQALPHMLNCDSRREMGVCAARAYAELEAGKPVSDPGKWAAPKDVDEARVNLRKIVFEALRWHPMLSMLGIRTALRDTMLMPRIDEKDVIAAEDMTGVKAGTKVLPMLLGAMHDPGTFTEPDRFCPFRREAEDHLHFGAGPHECVGRRMAEVQMEEIAHALFDHSFFQSSVKCGRIHYRGPAVVKLKIRRSKC